MRYTSLLMSLGLAASFVGMSLNAQCCSGNPDADGDTYCASTDCDDTNASVFPDAPELCDGVDNDCDGYTDDADSVVVNPNTYYQDTDGDGYGVSSVTAQSCSPQPGYAALAGDCDPADPRVHPGATEVCDNKDDNCDGSLGTAELDQDGDGFSACAQDCNEADASMYPGAPELCDGKDNNCDKTLPAEEQDADLDTYRACAGDCDDSDASMHPGAVELCDTVDQDCDGLADVQDDGSGGWSRSVCGPVLTGTSGTYDAIGVDQADIVWNPARSRFEAYYRAKDSSKVDRIGFAFSLDGTRWEKASAAVLNPGSTSAWDAKGLAFPSVLQVNGQYVMWYHAYDNANKIRIGRAVSTDGLTWTKNPATAVLEPSATGWDSKGASSPTVIYDATTRTYKMWYTGSDGTLFQTGYASSSDGITWTKRTSPVLTVGGTGTWDSKRVVFGRVQMLDGVYHMYYAGDDITNTYTYEIGYAFSMDGLAWTKLDDPILSAGTSAYDNFMVYAMDAVQTSEGWWGYYSGAPAFDGPYSISMAKNDQPDANIVAPDAGTSMRRGEPLTVQVQAYDRGLDDSLRLFVVSDLDGVVAQQRFELSRGTELSLPVQGLSAGYHQLKVLIFDQGGLSRVLPLDVEVE